MIVQITLFQSVMRVPVTTDKQEEALKEVIKLGIKRIGPVSIELKEDFDILSPNAWSNKKR